MAPYTAVVTVGPLFPAVCCRFTSREVYVEWVGMVDRARNHMSEGGGSSRELQMSWTSDDEMIEHMTEFFRQLEHTVRTFGIKTIPPDICCAAQTSNGILEGLGRPRMEAFDEESSVPPQHAGCELLGTYDSNEFGRGRLVPFQP